MPDEVLNVVIMQGGGGDSPQEQLVLSAQRAAALDLIAMLRSLEIEAITLATPDASWLPADTPVRVDLDPPGEAFHFGRRLAGLIRKDDLQHVLYFGGGSAPLLDSSLLSLVTALMGEAIGGPPGGRIPSHVVLTNNKHSSDWAAITHAPDALPLLEDVERDNSLAWVLGESDGYEIRAVSGLRPASGFDLDTPADLALMAAHPDCGPHLAAALDAPVLAALPVREVIRLAATPETNLTLIGRVSPLPWQALNRVTRCWVRVFAEERGMVASGRQARGEVKSLLGEMIRQQGPAAFFQTLATMTDAALIDTRPLMAAQGLWPSDADRFASDLFQVEAIRDPWLRDFTQAAVEAPFPVLAGRAQRGGGWAVRPDRDPRARAALNRPQQKTARQGFPTGRFR